MLLHKHYITILLQALLVLFAFASCIDDDFTGATSEPIFDENRPCYLTIRVASVDKSAQTRADAYTGEEDGANAGSGDFVHGDEEEHEIGKDGNFIVFFDKDDKLFTIANLEMENGHKDNPGHDNPVTDPKDYIEALYKTKIYRRKVVDKDYNIPASCLVVMNGGRIYKNLTSNTTPGKTSQDEILRWLWKEEQDKKTKPEEIGYDDAGHFTMTSDIVEIKLENFGIDAEGNEDPDNRVDLDVHVERILAKFTFESEKDIFQPSEYADLVLFNGFDDKFAPQYIAKKWCVKVTGWGINGLEKQSYVFKNIKADGNYFDGWNDPTHFRSYWSEDPDYANYNYPWQYRKSIDIANIKSYFENSSVITNYSFDDLNLGGEIENDELLYGLSAPIYTPEHTYNAEAEGIKGKLDDREELLAGTHLLVGAELQIEKDNEKNAYETKNWHRDRNGLYYRSAPACFAALMHAFSQLLTSQEALEYTLYNWDSYDTPDFDSYVANTSGGCYLYYKGEMLDEKYFDKILKMDDETFASEIGKMAPATLRRGDGKCLPWIENSIDNGYLKILDAKGNNIRICRKDKDILGKIIAGNDVREANFNDIKSLLYEWLGAIDHFSDGKMYYAHGIYNPLYPDDKNKTWGVVRNNWYRFKLTDIKSMGIPVDDPMQEIVPDRVDNEDKINVSIYLLDWHEVETDISTLPGL